MSDQKYIFIFNLVPYLKQEDQLICLEALNLLQITLPMILLYEKLLGKAF